MVVGQIVWAVVVAVFLVAAAIGWAMRGAMMVRDWLNPPKQRAATRVVQPEWLRFLSQRRMIFTSGLLLALAIYFLTGSMDRGLTLVGAVVLSFAYAVLCAMATGFTVWVRAQQHAQDGRPLMSETSRWAMWVGVGIGALAVLYLVSDVVTTLTA